MIRSGLYTRKEISCAILHENIAGAFTRIKILLQEILRKFLARGRPTLNKCGDTLVILLYHLPKMEACLKKFLIYELIILLTLMIFELKFRFALVVMLIGFQYQKTQIIRLHSKPIGRTPGNHSIFRRPLYLLTTKDLNNMATIELVRCRFIIAEQ